MAQPTVVVYGIDTCDQVRKARAWLRAQGVAFRFHDFRADGLDAALLSRWMGHLPWDALLNRRGLSWRQLDAARKASVVDQSSAAELMLANPTLIKRQARGTASFAMCRPIKSAPSRAGLRRWRLLSSMARRFSPSGF